MSTDSGLTGVELATAFDGKFERTGVSIGYHIGILLVAMVMVLMPLVYIAIIALAAAAVWWHATHDASMFHYATGGRVGLLIIVMYIAPIIAGAALVLFMILPIFWKSRKDPRPISISRRDEPLLYAYVDNLCDAMHVPRPVRIDVIAGANASAHIDNGMFGILRRRLVLTIGLPLATGTTVRQFTAVIAHEFGHFAQGSSMRLSYVVHRINRWFARMAWGRSGVDDALDGIASQGQMHWSIFLILLLCQFALGITRLILKSLAIFSHFLSMHLSRQAEYDADRRAARVVGSIAMEDALQMIPFLGVAHTLALTQARKGWGKRMLPDDLVLLTDAAYEQMPEKLKTSVTSKILTAEAGWFDTHPPLYKRVGALKKARLEGVLKLQAPATALFKDFSELCKLATIDFYRAVLGENLQAEHLFPTDARSIKSLIAAATADG